MSAVATNLIGRQCLWYGPGAPLIGRRVSKASVGRICAVFPQVHPQVAPRLGVEFEDGLLRTLPFDEIEVVFGPHNPESPTGERTTVGKELKRWRETGEEKT